MSGRLAVRWFVEILPRGAVFCALLVVAGAGVAQEPPAPVQPGDEPPMIMSEMESQIWEEHPDADWVEMIEFNPRKEYPKLLRMRYATEGAGYENGYFGVEGFIPLRHKCGESLWFAEARGFMSIPDQNLDDKPLGVNAGLAYRYYESAVDRVIGGYMFYDHRKTGLANFNQITAGLEVLGRVWDARTNFYAPIGDVREAVTFPDGTNAFQAAMTGFDFEVGRLVKCYDRFQLRAFSGFYYFEAESGNPAIGVEARVEGRLTENLLLNLSVQHDRLFDTNVVFSVVVNFPRIYPLNEKFNYDYAVDRLGDPIFRRINIMVDQQ